MQSLFSPAVAMNFISMSLANSALWRKIALNILEFTLDSRISDIPLYIDSRDLRCQVGAAAVKEQALMKQFRQAVSALAPQGFKKRANDNVSDCDEPFSDFANRYHCSTPPSSTPGGSAPGVTTTPPAGGYYPTPTPSSGGPTGGNGGGNSGTTCSTLSGGPQTATISVEFLSTSYPVESQSYTAPVGSQSSGSSAESPSSTQSSPSGPVSTIPGGASAASHVTASTLGLAFYYSFCYSFGIIFNRKT